MKLYQFEFNEIKYIKHDYFNIYLFIYLFQMGMNSKNELR